MDDDAGRARLTGPGAAELLQEALGDDVLLRWRVRQVDLRPGSGTTVAYDTAVRGPDGEARQLLGARLRDGELAVWRFPLDPDLPALRTAADADAVRDLLTSLGIPPGPPRVDVRAYRPGRRAVVEVRAPRCRLFLKVVRPSAVEALHERHRVLRDAGLPVARSLGWSPSGLLVLEALPGDRLRARLREGASAPSAEQLLALLDRLPRAVCRLPPRRSWTDAVDHYADLTATVLPEEADRCRQLAGEVRARTGDGPADEPAHGDLYEAQLLVDGDRISGLLDLDTVGPGRRADDLACLLAHASLLDLLHPTSSAAAAVDAWWPVFAERVAPAELRSRVAGVLVSLATGPWRVQQADWPAATRARLELAASWLDGSRPTPRR